MTRSTFSRRRRIRAASAAVLATAALVGGLTACSSGGSSAGGPTTLWALTGDQTGVVQPAVTAWNSAHPDQKITAQYFANDAYKTKIKTAVGAGSAPTIIYSWAGGTLADYVKAGKVADLTEDTAKVKTKYNESVWNLGVVDGKTYAVPMDPSYPVLMYFNKEVLDKAGVDVPKTWEDILAAIPKLKSAGVLPFALAGGSKWPELMWEEYLVDRVAGPDAFAAVEEGKKDAWSDPGIIKANTMIQQLVDAGAFGSDFNSVVADSNADVALLYTGKAAMLLQGAWAYGAFQSGDAKFTSSGLGYTNFPSVEDGKGDPKDIVGNVSGYFSVSANASDEQKKNAVDFLTEGVFDDAYTKRLLDSGQVPPVKGVSSLIQGGTESFLGQTSSLIDQAPSFQMSWDQALPSAQATALLTNLDKLFSKQITPKQFSDAMNETIGK
ncbi:extracellular solute-binding protein [Leifsonia sp. 1010]|uniref:extracellular solute-binding protein n=1 Tax=Leifsonia sp. 1010 TaxID=2817769 RepID=UPI002866CDB2|nr:extracellular solute-binding protein [Leifsonia sp. 1010]MDR6611921.1 raffinose/stachyose/melibiose transport system substrate-binding protein [Leifsonia sp. 1010]